MGAYVLPTASKAPLQRATALGLSNVQDSTSEQRGDKQASLATAAVMSFGIGALLGWFRKQQQRMPLSTMMRSSTSVAPTKLTSIMRTYRRIASFPECIQQQQVPSLHTGRTARCQISMISQAWRRGSRTS